MKKTGSMFLVVVILTSCTPGQTLSSTVSPTVPHIATVTPTETPIPTITVTPIPTIKVDGFNLPDPHFTNPELFDLIKSSAPIPQFVGAMKMAGVQISEEQVATELQYRQLIDKGGNSFYVALYHLDPDHGNQGEELEGDFPLLIARFENEEWVWNELTLNIASGLRDIKFGALLNLTDEEQKIVAEQCGSGVTFIGWEYTHSSPGKYDWNELNFNIRFSQQNKLQVVAAPLIWGQAVPEWVDKTADTPEQLRKIMLSHIDSAVKQFYGRVDYWEVVNEANHLGRDIFWNVLGPSYVNEAFARAQSIDPEAKLLYNDYINLFDSGDLNSDKRMAVIEQVVSSLAADGSIDVIGLQIDGNIHSFNMKKLEDALERLKKFGLPIIITEFSLRIDGSETPGNLSKQVKTAAQIMKVIKNCDCVAQVDQWGLPDSLTNAIYGDNANAGLYHENEGRLLPKPVIYGIIASFVLPSED
jgi:GH35 family endo-1,4-beta-xylanase